MGKAIVLDCILDPVLGEFGEHVITCEALPTLEGDTEELRQYAASILERFRNPFLDHRLEAIAMNSAAKVVVRLLPPIYDHLQRKQTLPPGLVLAFSAFLAYTGSIKGCEKKPVVQACSSILREAVGIVVARLEDGSLEVAIGATGLSTRWTGLQIVRDNDQHERHT